MPTRISGPKEAPVPGAALGGAAAGAALRVDTSILTTRAPCSSPQPLLRAQQLHLPKGAGEGGGVQQGAGCRPFGGVVFADDPPAWHLATPAARPDLRSWDSEDSQSQAKFPPCSFPFISKYPN